MQNKLATNAIYRVILNLFNLLVPLFVGPYIAGLLDPELYGMYNRVYAEFNVFLVLGTFGIYNYGMREVSRAREDPTRVNQLFTNLFVTGVAANLLVGVVYVGYALIKADGVDLYIYLIMTLQLIANMFYIEFVNEAVENYGFITKKTILIRLIYLISIFVFVRTKEDIIPYTLVICMTIFVNNFVSYLAVRRRLRFDFRALGDLRYQLIPLVVTLLLTNVEMLYGQLDKVLLGAAVSDIAVTEYTLPTTLVGMIGSLPLALVSVAIPRLSKLLGDGDRRQYLDTLHRTTDIFMAMIIPMAFGIMVLSREIMWLYSRDVYTYVYPVLIVAAGCRFIFAYQSIISNLVMYLHGMEKQLTFFLLIFGLGNLAMDMGLIGLGRFTPVTALASTGVVTALFVLVTSVFCKRRLNLPLGFFSKKIRGYYLVGALFIPIAYLVNLLKLGYLWNIALIVPLCAGIYGGYLLARKDPLIGALLDRLPGRKKTDGGAL